MALLEGNMTDNQEPNRPYAWAVGYIADEMGERSASEYNAGYIDGLIHMAALFLDAQDHKLHDDAVDVANDR